MIKLSKCKISNNEILSVSRVLKKEFLGSGEEVKKFESLLSKYFNSNAVCLTNGTSSIQLALQAAGIKKNDEVISQTVTYAATFQAIKATGAKIITCDVNNDMSIDLLDAAKKITKKTKAIVPVYYAGNVSNIIEIYNFAKKYKLKVIEDAAHAFGTTYKKKLIGSFNQITCFSFDGIKNITSGEGGCVVCKDKSIIKKINVAKNLGIEKINLKNKNFNIDITMQGWRYHMSDIMAAIGIEQFKKKNIFFKKRKNIAIWYQKKFEKNKKIFLLLNNFKETVPHIFPIRINGLKNKSLLALELKKKGIEIGGHYFPLHKTKMFRSAKCVRAEKLYQEIITLPIHVDITKKNVLYISKIVSQEIKKKKYFS